MSCVPLPWWTSKSMIAIFLYLYLFNKYLAPIAILFKIQKPAALFWLQWCPGGRTEQKAFLNSLFSTPSIAEIIEPAASNVAALLPGEIIVSPSSDEKPLFGKDFLTKSRYSTSWVSSIISSLIIYGFFHKRFLFFNFLKFSIMTDTLAICSGCPGPVSWFWNVSELINPVFT